MAEPKGSGCCHFAAAPLTRQRVDPSKTSKSSKILICGCKNRAMLDCERGKDSVGHQRTCRVVRNDNLL